MKTLKTFFIICIAISFSNCSSIKLTDTAPFNVTGATYHNWVGGQPGVSGTNLIIGVDGEFNVSFNKLYFQNRVVDAQIEDRNGKKYVIANFSTSAEKILVTRTTTTVSRTTTDP
mgnify:CR=1 FL=1